MSCRRSTHPLQRTKPPDCTHDSSEHPSMRPCVCLLARSGEAADGAGGGWRQAHA